MSFRLLWVKFFVDFDDWFIDADLWKRRTVSWTLTLIAIDLLCLCEPWPSPIHLTVKSEGAWQLHNLMQTFCVNLTATTNMCSHEHFVHFWVFMCRTQSDKHAFAMWTFQRVLNVPHKFSWIWLSTYKIQNDIRDDLSAKNVAQWTTTKSKWFTRFCSWLQMLEWFSNFVECNCHHDQEHEWNPFVALQFSLCLSAHLWLQTKCLFSVLCVKMWKSCCERGWLWNLIQKNNSRICGIRAHYRVTHQRSGRWWGTCCGELVNRFASRTSRTS